MKTLSRLNITFKNTLPIYFLISIITLMFLWVGNYLNTFSVFKEGLLGQAWFSLTYNLLYLIPQSASIFTGLSFIKKHKTKWFFRIVPSMSIAVTFIMILIFRVIGFFSENANLKDLYINLIIIIIMNMIFSTIIGLNIYSKIKKIFHIKDPNR